MNLLAGEFIPVRENYRKHNGHHHLRLLLKGRRRFRNYY
jgi:hypothetical protein